MAAPLKPSIEELNYFVIASVVVGAALTAFHGVFEPRVGVFYVFIGALTILLREFGQRMIAQWMDAEVELELSPDGSITTVVGAIISVLTGLPVILLFPVTNRYDVESYEHWGKSIDAMWIKREFWLVSGGIIALLIGWIISYSVGFEELSAAISFFTFFQLMPFDNGSIPTGKTDGATILKMSGFYWSIFMALTLISFALI